MAESVVYARGIRPDDSRETYETLPPAPLLSTNYAPEPAAVDIQREYVPATFGEAFNSARQSGLDAFEWEGKRYTTQTKEEAASKQQAAAPVRAAAAGLQPVGNITPAKDQLAFEAGPIKSPFAGTPFTMENMQPPSLPAYMAAQGLGGEPPPSAPKTKTSPLLPKPGAWAPVEQKSVGEAAREYERRQGMEHAPDPVKAWTHEYPKTANTMEGAGHIIEDFPEHFKASVAKIAKSADGGAIPFEDKDDASRWIAEETRLNAQRAAESAARKEARGTDETLIPGVVMSDFDSTAASVPFSVLSMGSGLTAGLAASVAGTPMAGWAAGTTASGVTALAMSKMDFMYRYRDAFKAAAIDEAERTKGAPLTGEERKAAETLAAKKWPEVNKALNDTANTYGLWEAIPEAVGNAGAFKVLSAPLRAIVGDSLARNVITRVAGVMGVELATEVPTAMGQSPAEHVLDPRAQVMSFDNPQDYWTSLKNVAPTTALTVAILGTAGAVGGTVYDREVRQPREAEQIKMLGSMVDEGGHALLPGNTLTTMAERAKALAESNPKNARAQEVNEALQREAGLRRAEATRAKQLGREPVPADVPYTQEPIAQTPQEPGAAQPVPPATSVSPVATQTGEPVEPTLGMQTPATVAGEPIEPTLDMQAAEAMPAVADNEPVIPGVENDPMAAAMPSGPVEPTFTGMTQDDAQFLGIEPTLTEAPPATVEPPLTPAQAVVAETGSALHAAMQGYETLATTPTATPAQVEQARISVLTAQAEHDLAVAMLPPGESMPPSITSTPQTSEPGVVSLGQAPTEAASTLQEDTNAEAAVPNAAIMPTDTGVETEGGDVGSTTTTFAMGMGMPQAEEGDTTIVNNAAPQQQPQGDNGRQEAMDQAAALTAQTGVKHIAVQNKQGDWSVTVEPNLTQTQEAQDEEAIPEDQSASPVFNAADVRAVARLQKSIGDSSKLTPIPSPARPLPGVGAPDAPPGTRLLTPFEARVIDAIASFFGFRTTYYLSGVDSVPAGLFHTGMPDRVFVDAAISEWDTVSPLTTIAHEIWHGIEVNHPAIFNAMRSRAMAKVSDAQLATYLKQYLKDEPLAQLSDTEFKALVSAKSLSDLKARNSVLYDEWVREGSGGSQTTAPRELATKEFLADMGANRWTADPDFWVKVYRDLVNKHGPQKAKSLFDKLRDGFVAMLTKVIGAFKARGYVASDAIVVKQLEEIRAAIQDATVAVIGARKQEAAPAESTAQPLAAPRRISKTTAAGNRSNRELSPDVALSAEVLIDRLVEAARRGESGKLWYENSAKQILKLFKGDLEAAEKFIRIVAITSANTEVGANITQALKAWRQYAAGQPFRVGTGSTNFSLTKTLYFGQPWGGTKTNTFYINLSEALHGIDSGFSTQDLHMARFGIGKDKPSELEYHILEEATRRAAEILGVLPRQVQAMVWVPQKAATIVEGWVSKGQHKDWTPEKMRVEALARAVKDYADMLRERGVKSLSQTAVTRITDDMRRKMSSVIALEAVPTELTEVGATVAKMSAAERTKFTNHVFGAMPPEDVVAAILGRKDVEVLPVKSDGGYGGRITPNLLISVVSRTGKPIARDEIAKVADALGFVYTQDGVPASRYDDTFKAGALQQDEEVQAGTRDPYERTVFAGAVFTLPGGADGKITPKQEKDFYALIREHLGSSAGFTKMGAADIVVGNYDALSIGDFHDRAAVLAASAGLDGYADTFMEGYYAYTNWENWDAENHDDGRGSGSQDGSDPGANRLPSFAAGSPALSSRLDSWRNRAVEAANTWLTDNEYAGKPLASPRRSDAAGDRRSGSVRSGTRENSVQVKGVHYSPRWVGTLDSSFHGKGMPGAEARRLDEWSATPEQRHRIYFYVDTGAGVEPESGVGNVPHYADLDNLYDWAADPLGFWPAAQAEGGSSNDIINRVEQAIMAAGFDGFYQHDAKSLGGNQGAAVLLGKRRVETSEDPSGEIKYESLFAKPLASPRRMLAAIKEVYKNPLLWDILLDESEARSGPSDGGCLICAKAIIRANGGGSLVRITSDAGGGQTEHYGADIGDGSIYDFGGRYSSPEKWVATFREREMRSPNERARKLSFATGYDSESDIPDDPFAEKKIAALLSGEGGVPLSSPRRGGFYSQLAETIEGTKQVALPGQQWKSWINANAQKVGVKLDEIHWSGVLDYLDIRAKDKVSKADVLGFLSENGVTVQDVMLGKPEASESDIERYYALHDKAELTDAESDEYERLAKKVDQREETKFASYTPPGGIPGTYREILVTLPNRTTASPERAEYEAWTAKKGFIPNSTYAEEVYTRETGKPVPPPRTLSEMDKDRAQNFRSSHFDQPNILVHLRTDEVIGADGKRYLRVVEIQSDWGQAGKKKGFDTGDKTPFGWGDTGQAKQGSIPSAPFVTDTRAWVSLGIKRAIQQAVSSGVDGIVFATGQQNADLYDLSKLVSTVYVTRSTPNGDFEISATDINGGQAIRSTRAKDISEVEGIIGKDLAKKVADMQPGDIERKYTGLDLKVGGEGMRQFYDTIVPSVANDVLKKLGGGKVRDIQGGPDFVTYKGFDITPAMKAKVEDGMPLFSPRRGMAQIRKLNITMPKLLSRTESDIPDDPFAEKKIAALLSGEGGVPLSSPRRQDDMFQRDLATKRIQTDTPAFKAWFGDSKVVDAEGKPLVVYHGGLKFDAFRESPASGAHYASDDVGVAEGYAGQYDDTRSENKPLFLRIEKPLDLRDEEAFKEWTGVDPEDSGALSEWGRRAFMAQSTGAMRSGGDVIERAKAAGYDGVIFYDTDVQNRAYHTSYAFFDPRQAKAGSADEARLNDYAVREDQNRGTFDSKNPSILKSPRRGGFYSQLAETIEGAKQTALPGQQWKAWINANAQKAGIKLDEIHWSGVLDYLDIRAKDKVTREDLVNFINDNGVQVNETMLGGGSSINPYTDPDELYVYQRQNGARPDTFRLMYSGDVVDEFDSYDEANAKRDEIIADMRDGTKYSGYAPPGGEPDTYREILVTLPVEAPAEATRYHVMGAFPLDGFATEAEAQAYVDRLKATEGLQDNIARAPLSVRSYKVKLASPVYKSSHWDQPNILAHLRVDEIDSDTLRVIELQSDWGQAGRKDGFVTPEARAKHDAAQKAVRAYADEMAKKHGRNWTNADLSLEELDALDDLVQARSEAEVDSNAVPAAPFVTDTKAWVALGLKKAIQYAVSNNLDTVVIATGKQNAALYDMRNQVDELLWDDIASDETGTLTARQNNYNKMKKPGIKPAELADYVGKELAERLLKAKRNEYGIRSLKGVDLEIGGEGMIDFYDRIVPQVANDVLKKLGGGKVRDIQGGPDRSYGDYGIKERAIGGFTAHVGKEKANWSTWEDANAWVNERLGVTYKGFDITPAMKAKVEDGMPLFSPRRDMAQIRKLNITMPKLLSRTEQGKADDTFTALHDEATKRLLAGTPIPVDARVLPMTAMPAVLRLLGAPNQIVAMDTSVLGKLRVKDVEINGKHGHAAELKNVSAADMNRILRDPAMVFVTDDGEYELVSDTWGDAGPLTMVVKPNVAEKGDETNTRFAKVMSVYSRPVTEGKGSVAARLKEALTDKGGRALMYFDPARYAGVIGKKAPPTSSARVGLSPASHYYAGNIPGEQDNVLALPSAPQSASEGGIETKRHTPDEVMRRIADRRVKSWLDLVKFIGNNYAGPVAETPLFSPRRGGADAPFDASTAGLNYEMPDVDAFMSPDVLATAREDITHYRRKAEPVVVSDDDRKLAEKLLRPKLQLASEATADYTRGVDDIVRRTPALGRMIPPLKKLDRAVEKLVVEGGLDIDSMKDLLRGTIVVSAYEDAQSVLDAIAGAMEVLPGRVKNRTPIPLTMAGKELPGVPMATGYQDVLLNIRMPNGIVAEIQINTPEMISAKEKVGHYLYEADRAASKPVEELTAAQRRVYADAAAAAVRRASAKKASSVDMSPVRGSPPAGRSDTPSSDNRNTLPSGKRTKESPPEDMAKREPAGNLSGSFMGGTSIGEIVPQQHPSALEERAKRFAAKAHGRINQRRKYTNEPYIVHPAAVAETLRASGATDEMLAAAWLHDVVEDTHVSLGEIRARFGDRVAALVRELTKAEQSEGNRKQRAAIDRTKIAASSTEAKTIKLADIYDNIKDIAARDPAFAKVYLAEKADQLDALRGGDPVLWDKVKSVIDENLAGAPLASRRRAAPMPPEETKAAAARRVSGDLMKRFEVLEQWGAQYGVSGNDVSVYSTELALPGRIAARVQDFREKTVEPLVKRMQKAGFQPEEVAQFMHAQHAGERNARIAAINPAFPDGGSGMDNKTAADILKNARALPNYAELEALAKAVRAISDDTKKLLLDAGIINQATVNAWESAYQFYVPLRGGPEDGAQQGAGKGLSVSGKQKRALGHGVRDEFIIEHILRGYERAVHQSERNRVGEVLVKWLQAMNNPNLGTVGEPEKRGVLTPGSKNYSVSYHGAVVAAFSSKRDAFEFINDESLRFGRTPADFTITISQADPHVAYMATPLLGPNEVAVYRDGDMIRVQLNDDLLLRAYTRMGVEQMGAVLDAARGFNRYLSMMYTGRNPEFILVNMTRDALAAPINITGEYGADVAARMVSLYPGALRDMFRYSVTGKATPILEQYRLAGGSTGAAWLTDLERLAKDVGQAYEDYQGALRMAANGKPGKATVIAGRKLVHGLTFWIEHLNAATENAMRLAAYEAVLKKTGDEIEAVRAAKNVTVNFNKQGEVAAQLGALQLFYNPTVQGGHTIYHALTKGKHKGQAIALTATLPILGYLMAAMGDGDDDLEAASDYEKSRNIIIPLSDGKRLDIPMPYGYSWFYNMGQFAYRLGKDSDLLRFATDAALSFQDNFSPVRVFDEEGFTPSELPLTEPAKMVLRLDNNRSSFGSEIVPENKFDPGMPDSAKMFRTTAGGFYDNLTRAANEATGGSKTQPGGIDVSPETLKFWWTSMTGGAGAFAESTISFAKLAASEPSAIEVRDVPVLRKFVKDATTAELRSRYFGALAKAREADTNLKRAWKGDDAPGESIAIARGKGAEVYFKMLDNQRNYLGALNADRMSIQNNKEMSVGEKRLRLKTIEKQEEEVYRSMLVELPEEMARR